MSTQNHLDNIRNPKRLPNRESDRPVRVSSAYQQTIEVLEAPRIYQLSAARPGRIPRSATLVSGPRGSVRVVGTFVFFDAQEDGKAVLEVIY